MRLACPLDFLQSAPCWWLYRMRGLRSVAGTVVAAALLAAAAPRIAWGDVRTATHDDAPPEPRPFDLLA